MIQAFFIFLRFLAVVMTRKPVAILLLLLLLLLMGYFLSFGLLTVQAASAETRTKARARTAMKLATQNFKKGNYDVAIKYTTTAIRLSPEYLDAYRFRGSAHAFKREYSSAIKDFTYVLRRKPKHFSTTYYLRGDCFVAIGLLERGIKDYTTCLKYNPKDGKVWYYKARALALSGKTVEALQTIQRGIATKTHHMGKLEKLQKAIFSGDKIPYHAPCSN
ncbi:MAG: tetratricopeptide repeat protein [Clostridiales bacterium]|nr:tetratricopeptide repeat protein [Clostridiales bacterium]